MDYIVLNQQENLGTIAINKAVFSSIVKGSLMDIENLSLLEKDTFGKKPVVISIGENRLNIEVAINVKYGASVNATSGVAQNKIYENIVYMTGLKPNDITVNVIGFDI